MAMIDSKAAVPEPIAPGRRRRVRDDVHQHEPFEPIAIIRIAVAALGAAAVWFRVYEPVAQVSVIGLLALAFSVWPVLREALANLLARRMTMELSMLIAIVAAAAIAEIFTALVVTLFVLVAEELEHLTIARGRRAIGDLVAFIPREARIRRGDDTVMVPVDTVALGDIVLVNPGEKIPVDGDVVAGHSSVDQSRITGESMPVDKTVGGAVYAGSINHMGALEIRVERVGRDTSYGQIIEAVEAAEHSRAPVQKLADRLAGYLVYVAAICAALTWLITRDMRDTISVIIVAGACGIAAGTPIAILGGIGRAARLGAIIKGGIHLETLGRIDTIVLDKTGTLTLGQPGVEQILPAPGVDPLELLRLTAAAEMRSEHPLARAVVEEASARGLVVPEPTEFDYTVARGITAVVEGRTVLVGNRALLEEAGITAPARDHAVIGSDIVVAADGRFIGEIIVADALRPEARAAMAALAAIGVRTLLFSGDSSVVATSVAREIGIAEAVGDMLPQDKLVRVRALVKEGRVVGMVGDGVNDAPALTAASLGIAMGAGTDIAKDSADIILIGNDLLKLVDTLQIAKRTRSVIWQNFAGTLIVDAIGIALAATGFLSPVIAAFIHVGSELVFLGNSARMLPRGAEDEPAPPAMPLVAPATVENA